MPLPKQAELDELEPTLDTPSKISLLCAHKELPDPSSILKLGQPSFWSFD
jgi:hypothetical protein